MEGTPPVNRHVFGILFAVSILHLVFSFVLWIPIRVSLATPFGLRTDGLFILLFLAQLAFFAVLVYAGLRLGRDVGLGAPLLGSWVRGEPAGKRAISLLAISVVAGLGVSALKYLLDLLVFSPFLPATLSQLREAHVLLRLAIPFQQGISEEVIYRLFLMTVIVWILWRIGGQGENSPGVPVYWAGILIAGLVTLAVPFSQGVTGLALAQYAAILLAGAIPFGWLYWKKGIEAAIVAHFVSSVALVLLTLG